jgi:hypothetical protein
MRMVSRITEKLGVQVPIDRLFSTPTIAELAESVNTSRDSRSNMSEIKRISRRSRRTDRKK